MVKHSFVLFCFFFTEPFVLKTCFPFSHPLFSPSTAGMNPLQLLKGVSTEELDERARLSSFKRAFALAALVKRSSGNKGMDMFLQSIEGRQKYAVLHGEPGRGTTLAHQMVECARDALLEEVMDCEQEQVKFKQDLMKIAMTTLSFSKILSQVKEHFAKLAVGAVMRLKGSRKFESIQIIKKQGGSLKNSFLKEGFILDKEIGVGQPKCIENAKILVAEVTEVEGAEKDKMGDKVKKMINHGINCFVVDKQLKFPEELLAEAGVVAINFDGIEQLALVTCAEIVSTFDNPESVELGECKLIQEIVIGGNKLIHFSGVAMGQACTIVLRGASPQLLNEAERVVHHTLGLLSKIANNRKVLFGGRWPETMAKFVDEVPRKTPGDNVPRNEI